MIRHICMFTIKEENKKESIAEFIRRAESLKALPQLKGYSVVTNAPGTPESNYDVALIFDFDNAQDLDIYQKSDLHVEFGKFVATIKKDRACIDHEF